MNIDNLKNDLANAEAEHKIAIGELNEANSVCRKLANEVKRLETKVAELAIKGENFTDIATDLTVAKQAYAEALPSQAAGNRARRAAEAKINLARKLLLDSVLK